jgi:hypothetical protein
MSNENIELNIDFDLESNVCEKLFDIVILLGPNDVDKINRQLEYNKKNIIGYRNIYIIPYDPTIQFEGCITIPETMFPFNVWSVYNFHGKTIRASWYLQQLFKLYAGFVIPDMLERYLIIDSDTIFLKPTKFIVDGLSLYNFHHYGNCYQPYLSHMKRLHPCFNNLYFNNICGITHHMIFEKKYVKEIIEMVEKQNDNNYFYDIFLYKVDQNYILGSGASEYELYFNYMLNFHRDKILIRPLKLVESGVFDEKNPYDADYISIHSHLTKNAV